MHIEYYDNQEHHLQSGYIYTYTVFKTQMGLIYDIKCHTRPTLSILFVLTRQQNFQSSFGVLPHTISIVFCLLVLFQMKMVPAAQIF